MVERLAAGCDKESGKLRQGTAACGTLTRTWINVRRLQLGQQSGRIMGMKFVRSVIPRGRWSIRIYMPATEMPAGYIDAWSGTQPVVKR